MGPIASTSPTARGPGGRQPRRAFYFQWHITHGCNLSCAHCYDSKHVDIGTEVSAEEAQRIACELLFFARRLGCDADIALTGGEPLTKIDVLLPVLETIQMHQTDGFRSSVTIMTNGQLVTDSFLAEIQARYDSVEAFQVSVDGLEATHERTRGRGTFQRAIGAIRMIRDRGFRTYLHVVPTSLNIEEVEGLVDLASQLNVDSIVVSRYVPPPSEFDSDHLVLPVETYKDLLSRLHICAEAMADARDARVGRSVIVRARCDLWQLIDETLSRSRVESEAPLHRQLGAMCPVGISGLTILPDGGVLHCRRLPIQIGNVRSETLFDIWYGDPLRRKLLRKSEFFSDECSDCDFFNTGPYSRLCRGGAPCISYSKYQSVFRRDPMCWFQPGDHSMSLPPHVQSRG